MALPHPLPHDRLSDDGPAPGRAPLPFAPPRATAPVAVSDAGQARPDDASAVFRRARRRTGRPFVLIAVIAAHVAAAVGFSRLQPAQPDAPAAPITVSLITPPAPPVVAPPPPEPVPPPEPPPPEIPKPPPKPVVKRPAPKPVRKAPPPAPVVESKTALAAEEPAPAEPSPPPPEPAPAPPPTPVATAPAPSAPRAPEVVAARFDAAYLNNPPPAYPPLARRMREEGKVLLRVFVTADGAPGKIELSASSGSRRLDAAAENAVTRWRFVPAKQGERNVDAWVVVPIVFKLEG